MREPTVPAPWMVIFQVKFFVMEKHIAVAAMLLLNVLYLNGQCTVTGQVTDAEGEPLPGANVMITDIRKGGVADANGVYRIENVPVGEHAIQASYVGYASERKTTEVTQNVSKLIVHLQLKKRIVEIDELVVRATRATEKTPMTYVNLPKEELETNNLGQDVPFVLRWTPSTVVTSDAGAGIGYTGLRIRGTDPTRINVTINGIPLNDAESQGVFWVNLPDFLSSTSDIQVQRGVGTSTNGAGAFGASINLSTAELDEQAYARVNGSVGSFNTRKTNVQVGTGLLDDRFSFQGRLSTIQSDGYIDRASSDLDSWFISGAYQGEKSVLRANVFSGHEVTYQAWYGVPADSLDTNRTFNSAGTEKDGAPYDNEVDDYRQTHYQVLYNVQATPNWNLNLAAHYTRGQGFFEQYKADQTLADYGIEAPRPGGVSIETTDLIRRLWLDNDFYGLVYSAGFLNNTNRLDLTLGGAFNIYEGRHFGEVIWARFAGDSEIRDRYYDNDARKTDFNIYGKLNYELLYGLNAYLDLQYRRVGYEFLGFNRAGENVTQNVDLHFFNPKAGLFYALDDQTNLYASFAVANREPNRNDYVETTADSRPEPETLYNTELGYRRNWQRAALGVNLYHMFYRNQLALNGEVNDVGAYTRVNIDRSYRLGVEVIGGFQLLDDLRLEGTATLSRNKVASFTEFIDVYDENFGYQGQEAIAREETDLSFSPEIIASGQLSWDVLAKAEKQDLNVTLLSKYVGKQYIDNSSDENNVIDPYFFSDLRLRYQWQAPFAKEVTLTLLVQNLWDAEYETNAYSYRYQFAGERVVDRWYYPQAGRNFLLGLTLGF